MSAVDRWTQQDSGESQFNEGFLGRIKATCRAKIGDNSIGCLIWLSLVYLPTEWGAVSRGASVDAIGDAEVSIKRVGTR